LNRLLDLLCFQPDSLIVDEYALALVWLRLPPLPEFGGKLRDHLPVGAFQQYSRWLRNCCLDALWNRHLDRMCVAEFQGHELLSGILGLFRGGRVFDCGSVANANEPENADVTLGDAGDCVLKMRARGAWLLISYVNPFKRQELNAPHMARW